MPPLLSLHYPGYTFMFRAELVRRGLPMRREVKEILFMLATDDKRNGNTTKVTNLVPCYTNNAGLTMTWIPGSDPSGSSRTIEFGEDAGLIVTITQFGRHPAMLEQKRKSN